MIFADATTARRERSAEKLMETSRILAKNAKLQLRAVEGNLGLPDLVQEQKPWLLLQR